MCSSSKRRVFGNWHTRPGNLHPIIDIPFEERENKYALLKRITFMIPILLLPSSIFYTDELANMDKYPRHWIRQINYNFPSKLHILACNYLGREYSISGFNTILCWCLEIGVLVNIKILNLIVDPQPYYGWALWSMIKEGGGGPGLL